MVYTRETGKPGKVYSAYMELSNVDQILADNDAIWKMSDEKIFKNHSCPTAYQQIAVVTIRQIIGVSPYGYGDKVHVYLRDTEIRVTRD